MQVHELITELLKVDGALEVEIEIRSMDDEVLLIDNVKSDCTGGRRRLLIETIEK